MVPPLPGAEGQRIATRLEKNYGYCAHNYGTLKYKGQHQGSSAVRSDHIAEIPLAHRSPLPVSMVLFESASTTGSGVEIGFPQASHRLNITPPFYFCDLSKAGLRIIFCDKPRSSDGYANLIRILEEFCSHKLKAKKAKKYDVTAIVLSFVLPNHVFRDE